MPPPTEDEIREHAISFAYGNCILDGCTVTREMIRAEADKLKAAYASGVEDPCFSLTPVVESKDTKDD